MQETAQCIEVKAVLLPSVKDAFERFAERNRSLSFIGIALGERYRVSVPAGTELPRGDPSASQPGSLEVDCA